MAVESQQWNRKDVEGSLFLLKRRGSPRFQMLVLNKCSTENYVEDIHGGLDFELNPPYLMYTHGNSEIIGVWFYEQDDLRQIEEILKRIKHTNQGSHPSPPATAQAQARPQAGGKSDDEGFWDKSAPSTAAAAQPQQAPAAQQPAQQRPAASASNISETGSSNLANLLRNAQLKQQQQQQASASAGPAPLPSAPSAPLPQPLPPSFFAQQQRPPPQQPPPAAPAPAPAPLPAAAAAPAPLPTAASHPQPHPHQRISQVIPAAGPAPTGDQQSAVGGQLGGPLAALFANAHKAPQAAPPPAPLTAPPSAALQPAPGSSPPQAAAAAAAAVAGPLAVLGGSPRGAAPVPAAAAGPGVSDEERVRRLLTRIATNDGLLKMLAAEMRAVGML